MRLRFFLIPVCTLYLVVFAHTVLGAPAQGICALPSSLQDEVSKKYPAARPVSMEDLSEEDRQLFRKDHGIRCPGVARVDFYGDGKPTWALVLITGENLKRKAVLVVAHQGEQGWETHALETTDGTPVVWGESPGKYEDLDGKKTIHASSPVIVFAGLESWAVVYAWTGKAVEKVQVSD